jgi:glycosyltransferase involved in cell wall biosynthesis
MISILVPTRKRCARLKELYYSAVNTADKPEDVEFIVYVDDDDGAYDGVELPGMTIIRGPQISIAEAWNKCWKQANGEWLGLFGDDVVFQSKGWDTAMLERIAPFKDNIGFVFGYDGSPYNDTYGTHGFIHQNWANQVGYFVPPYFKANYVDLWLNNVAKALNRHMYFDSYFEHKHQGMGKAADDETYQIGRDRDAGMAELYKQLEGERQKDIETLKQFIEESK